jgi:hypothetical protein
MYLRLVIQEGTDIVFLLFGALKKLLSFKEVD